MLEMPRHYLVEDLAGKYVRVPIRIDATQRDEVFRCPTVVHTENKPIVVDDVDAMSKYLDTRLYGYSNIRSFIALDLENLVIVEWPKLVEDDACWRVRRRWFVLLAAKDVDSDDARILRPIPDVLGILGGPEVVVDNLNKRWLHVRAAWHGAYPNDAHYKFGWEASEMEKGAVDSAIASLVDARRAQGASVARERSKGLRLADMPVLGLDELSGVMTNNAYLTHVVHSFAKAKAGHDPYCWVGCSEAELDDDDWDGPRYDPREIVHPLLRLGIHVQVETERIDSDKLCILKLFVAGCAPSLRVVNDAIDRVAHGANDNGSVFLYGNSPRQLRLKGVVKCVPKLLAWLRSARIALVDPAAEARADCTAVAAQAVDLDPMGRTEAEVRAREQDARKRKLVDAVYADDDDVANGCRWAGLVKRFGFGGGTGKAFPFRVCAVRGDIFCFQNMSDTELAHRNEFEVAWLGNTPSEFRRGIELEAAFVTRGEFAGGDDDEAV